MSINEELINNLRFADDLVIMAENTQDLTHMLKNLKNESGRFGLTMNSSKTNIMSTNEKVGWLQIDELRIEKVTEYTYLGQIITLDNKTNVEIGRSIANGWKA